MMEFTLSRLTLIVCGAVLLASVASPICDLFEREGDERISSVADDDAEIIDSFCISKLDTFRLQGDAMLPSPQYGLVIEGHFVHLFRNGEELSSAPIKCVSERIELSYGETVDAALVDGTLVRI